MDFDELRYVDFLLNMNRHVNFFLNMHRIFHLLLNVHGIRFRHVDLVGDVDNFLDFVWNMDFLFDMNRVRFVNVDWVFFNLLDNLLDVDRVRNFYCDLEKK